MNKKIILAAVVSMFAISPVNESFAEESGDLQNIDQSLAESVDVKKDSVAGKKTRLKIEKKSSYAKAGNKHKKKKSHKKRSTHKKEAI